MTAYPLKVFDCLKALILISSCSIRLLGCHSFALVRIPLFLKLSSVFFSFLEKKLGDTRAGRRCIHNWFFEAAIGGTTGKLLEVNSQAILKIRANLAASQVRHLDSFVELHAPTFFNL